MAAIKKYYMQHWAVKDLPSEFKVACYNKWEVHPVNIASIKTVGKNYTVLVESERGPIMIEHNRDCLAVQFNIEKKYPETLQVVANFIAKMAENVKSYAQLSEMKVSMATCPGGLFGRRISRTREATTAESGEEKIRSRRYTNVFVHAGMSYSKKMAIFVPENNAMGQQALKVSRSTKIKRISSINRKGSTFSSTMTESVKKLERGEIRDVTPKTISKILHPKLGSEFVVKEDPRPKIFRRHKMATEAPICRYREFKKLASSDDPFSTILCSTPYANTELEKRREETENKKRWIAGHFKAGHFKL